MKKFTIVILITLVASFAFGLTPKAVEQVESEQDVVFFNYEDIYFRVANDPELSKIEDWETSISNIWNYAQKENVEYIKWQTIKELLECPTDFI